MTQYYLKSTRKRDEKFIIEKLMFREDGIYMNEIYSMFDISFLNGKWVILNEHYFDPEYWNYDIITYDEVFLEMI